MRFQVLEFNIGELQQGRYPFQFLDTAQHIAFNLAYAASGRASSWNVILILPEDVPEPLRSYTIAQRKISALDAVIQSGALTTSGKAVAQDLLKQNWQEVSEHDSVNS